MGVKFDFTFQEGLGKYCCLKADSKIEEGSKLYNWCKNVMERKREESLDKDEALLLDAVNFTFDLKNENKSSENDQGTKAAGGAATTASMTTPTPATTSSTTGTKSYADSAIETNINASIIDVGLEDSNEIGKNKTFNAAAAVIRVPTTTPTAGTTSRTTNGDTLGILSNDDGPPVTKWFEEKNWPEDVKRNMKKKRPTFLVENGSSSGMAPNSFVTNLHLKLSSIMPRDTHKYVEDFVKMKLLKFINYEEEYGPEEHLDILYYQWFYDMINNGYASNELIFDPFNPTSITLPKVDRVYDPVTVWLNEEHWPYTVKNKLAGRRYQGLVEPKEIQKNMSDLNRVEKLEYSLAHLHGPRIKHVKTFLEWELLKLMKYDKVEAPDSSGLDDTYYKWFYEQILKGFAKETLTFEPYKKFE